MPFTHYNENYYVIDIYTGNRCSDWLIRLRIIFKFNILIYDMQRVSHDKALVIKSYTIICVLLFLWNKSEGLLAKLQEMCTAYTLFGIKLPNIPESQF